MDCKFCGSSSLEPDYIEIFELNGKPVESVSIVCKQCGGSFLSNCPAAAELEEFYNSIGGAALTGVSSPESIYNQYESAEEKYPNTKVDAKRLVRYYVENAGKPSSNTKILDFGAGLGEIAAVFRESYGVIVDNFEKSKACQQVIRLRGGRVVEQGDLLNPENPQYDGIFLSQVLEHIPPNDLMLREVLSRLSDRGLVIVAVPNHAGIYKFLRLRFNNCPPEHLLYFTPQALAMYMHNHFGLKCISWGTVTRVSVVSRFMKGRLCGFLERLIAFVFSPVDMMRQGLYLNAVFKKG